MYTPPVEDVSLDPHSEEYFQQLVAALDLETDIYAHVDLAIMSKFKALIRKYSHASYLPGSELTPITGFHHNIDTGDSPPVYRLPYRKSPSELAAIKDELQKMLKLHIIRPSFSSWGAPCILVRKPLEKGLPQPPRFVVDYRGLNTVTAGDGYPIPSVSNVLDALSGGKKFAKLDLASGYWQVLVNPDHMHKTAFATHLGLYEFLRMPYGLKTAPQTFQRILNSVFADFLYQWLIIYIDDVIVWANTAPTTCVFFSQDLEILGHRVTPSGRFPTSKGTEAISAMPRPHNVSPISGTTNITPFFLVFGRDAPSPETISFDLPVNPLPPDHYARHLLSRMKVAHQQFSQVKSDLRRHQKEVYDRKARFLAIPPGKIVYVRKEPQTHKPGMATRFLRSFDGPFQVIGHPYDRNDLLTLKNLSTGAVIPHPVNIEKCVVIPEQETFDLQPSNDSVVESEPEAESPAPLPTASHVNPELCQVAYEFGKYLASLPNKTATASQACKQVYLSYPSAREILTRHGKLRGLIKACPYLQMDGEAHGGLYLLSLNQEAFRKLFPSL